MIVGKGFIYLRFRLLSLLHPLPTDWGIDWGECSFVCDLLLFPRLLPHSLPPIFGRSRLLTCSLRSSLQIGEFDNQRSFVCVCASSIEFELVIVVLELLQRLRQHNYFGIAGSGEMCEEEEKKTPFDLYMWRKNKGKCIPCGGATM